jgi:hypothetical protein
MKEIKENEMGRTCSMLGEDENYTKLLIGTPEGKRPR